MEIWLVNAGKDRIKLPVNPEELGEKGAINYYDVTIANGEERTIIRGRNQDEYTISSYFPRIRPYFAEVADMLPPMTYVERIKGWKDAKKVLHLQVTGTKINVSVTIRSFNWTEKGGLGDVEYELDLKQYSPLTYTSVNHTHAKRPSSGKVNPKVYTIVRGDCLWDLAKEFYGSGAKWTTIYNANKGVIGPNPHWIYPGQKVVIP